MQLDVHRGGLLLLGVGVEFFGAAAKERDTEFGNDYFGAQVLRLQHGTVHESRLVGQGRACTVCEAGQSAIVEPVCIRWEQSTGPVRQGWTLLLHWQ